MLWLVSSVTYCHALSGSVSGRIQPCQQTSRVSTGELPPLLLILEAQLQHVLNTAVGAQSVGQRPPAGAIEARCAVALLQAPGCRDRSGTPAARTWRPSAPARSPPRRWRRAPAPSAGIVPGSTPHPSGPAAACGRAAWCSRRDGDHAGTRRCARCRRNAEFGISTIIPKKNQMPTFQGNLFPHRQIALKTSAILSNWEAVCG